MSTGGSGYVTQSGTSFATAIVSGVAALVRSRFSALSGPDVVHRLEATAIPLTGARDETLGAGLVDPFAALTAQLPGTGVAARPGSVAVLPLAAAGSTLPTAALGWGAGLTLLALLAGLGGLAWRRAARRKWAPGPVPEPATASRPHPADLEMS